MRLWRLIGVGLLAGIFGCRSTPVPGSRGAITVFVVLDTVRADHIGACGEARPLTPTLDALVAEGAALSCTAVAPGSWTLPSHASFFTGLEVHEHGAHALARPPKETVPESGRKLGPARKLAAEIPVLAEGMPSVMVSGNPVLGPSSGLSRGFRHRTVAPHFGRMYGKRLVRAVKTVLKDQVRDGDLLFINIADAHTPYRNVPEDHPFLPPRTGLKWDQGRIDSDWYRFVSGTPDAELEARTRDLYAYGVQRADRTLGWVLDAIEAAGFSRTRLVLTSDHGEYLGEHGLLGHGHYLHDENQVVPLLVQPGALPDGFISAAAAYDLVQGHEPRARPVRAAAWPHAKKAALFEQQKFHITSARSWDPPMWWTSDEPVPDGPPATWIAAVEASGTGMGDEGLHGLLEQLGYQ